MSSTRKVLITALLAALVLGVAALPGSAAPEKKFSATAPTNVAATATQIVVRIKNVTPNGNSNINSLTITGDGPTGFAISAVTPGTYVLSNGGETVSITDITSIRPDESRDFTLTVSIPNLECTDGTIAWAATAFTGNALGGDAFRLQDGSSGTQSLSQLTTQISTGCTTISVSKYEDTDVSGAKNGTEGAPSTEFTFDLKQGASTLQSVTTTGGVASFSPVASGTYSICETAKTGWTNTEPGGTGCTSVTVSGAATTVTFGNAADATITVTKHDDPNFNGALDEGEGVLSGWTFQLKDGGGNAIGLEQGTDENGQITYSVPAGSAYSVCETDPRSDPSSLDYAADPWVNTSPGGDRCADIAASSVSSGAGIGVDFHNAQGTLGCDLDNSTDTQSGGGTTADLTRLPNSDESPCILVPYSLTADTDTVVFTKDISTQPFAVFQLLITWGTPPGQYGAFKVSVFDPDGVPDNEDDYTPDNCAVTGGEAQPPAPNATEHWCFAGMEIVPVGSSFVAQETYLGSGDPTIRYK